MRPEPVPAYLGVPRGPERVTCTPATALQ
jgi:hypothetical protein